MGNSILATVRNAMSGDTGISENEENGDAARLNEPSQQRSDEMGKNDNASAGNSDATISQLEHDAAVAEAVTEGRASGAEAANLRMAAVLGADGIKGDGKRMSAGLDLAMTSPDMKADAVAAFVVANVSANGTISADAYEESKTTTTPDAQPQGGAVPVKSGLSKLVGSRVERMTA